MLFLSLLFLQAYFSVLTFYSGLTQVLSPKTMRLKISTFLSQCLRNSHIYLSKKLTMLGFFNSFITRISLMINSFFGCFCKLICLIATYDGKKIKNKQTNKMRTGFPILLENYKYQSVNNLIYLYMLYNKIIIYSQVALLFPHWLGTMLYNI